MKSQKQKKWIKKTSSRESQRRYQAKKAKAAYGDDAFEYIWDRKQERFDAFVVSDQGSRIRCHYPVARLFVNGQKRLIGWTVEELERYLLHNVEELNSQFAEHWHVELAPKALRRKGIGA